MNMLLLRPEELDDNDEAQLTGPRAEHLRAVLKVEPGKQLRAGRLRCERGTAEVLAVDPTGVRIRYLAGPKLEPAATRCLLLAVPRPKVLSRCLEHATALGYTRIGLFRSYRVERAHLLSHKLRAADVEQRLLDGMQQGCRVDLPTVEVFDRFRPFVEDRLPDWVQTDHRFVAHPAAAGSLVEQCEARPDYALAIGPEGGFIPYEVDSLRQQGFAPVSAATGPLRVESALSYFTGQLDALTRTTWCE